MRKPNILIVEDERIVALSIKEILISESYNVCSIVNSVNKAINEIDFHRPNIVIMDIKIKGDCDGIELARHIKDKFSIPSVFLTAYSDKELIERAKLVEPLGYILKPFNRNEIISTLKIALYRSKKEQNKNWLYEKLKESIRLVEYELNNEKNIRKNIENELKLKSCFLDDANKALIDLIDNKKAENRAYQQAIMLNIKKCIFPYIEILKRQNLNRKTVETVDFLEKSLTDIFCLEKDMLFAKYIDLTPQEVKIADLIRHGKTTKEIAEILNIAASSVSTHRYNIRKKIGILNSNTNLERYLNSTTDIFD